jgi:hypothetical protein
VVELLTPILLPDQVSLLTAGHPAPFSVRDGVKVELSTVERLQHGGQPIDVAPNRSRMRLWRGGGCAALRLCGGLRELSWNVLGLT